MKLALQDRVMLAMNGPGDSSKLSRAQAETLRKAALAKAMEAKKAALEKKPAKVIKPSAKTKVVKKAAAKKKVVRKTMKPKKKR